MSIKTLKEKQRDAEILQYKRDMFWHESEKQRLIGELLKKIYELQDEVSILKTKCSNLT